MKKQIPTLKSAFLFVVILFSTKSFAEQKDSAQLKITGYVDAYYAYYTDSVAVGGYQQFPTVSPKSNHFGINALCVNFCYDGEKVRAMAGLHYGDIARSSWGTSTFPWVMEAHAGVKLCKTLWVDAGLFRTHVGAEGLLPKENLASSIAIPTYYEPYYEAGVRLNYNPTEKLAINVLVLNGYNIFEDNNTDKSIGALVTYALGENRNIGYSNYFGNDAPMGATSKKRMYHNIFFNYQMNKLKMQVGVDYAMQEKSDIKTATQSASMISGLATLKYECCKNCSVYGRGEYFNDKDGFLSGTYTDKNANTVGLNLWGATLGFEYKPTDFSYIRLEGRELMTNKNVPIFRTNGKSTNARTEAMLHVGVSF
ncbi:MAG: outer membrane beta-barrel protein [Bacteroidetes bacterium]|nr:outer membrane beta-barrel protein [Bacteroidota bacterium]